MVINFFLTCNIIERFFLFNKKNLFYKKLIFFLVFLYELIFSLTGLPTQLAFNRFPLKAPLNASNITVDLLDNILFARPGTLFCS